MKNAVKVFKRFNSKNYIASSHDVSDGGLAVALSECCILSSKGAYIQLEEKMLVKIIYYLVKEDQE